jgi:hypothetical protein
VPSAVVDFGPSVEGDKLKHSFVIQNTGSSALLIDRIDSSCGCTATVLKSRDVAPGASTQVELTFDTTGRPGPNHKMVSVVSNDPSTPRYMLEFKTIVESLVGMEPRAVFKKVDSGSVDFAEAWVIGKSAELAKLSVQSVDHPESVSVETISREESGKHRQGIKIVFRGTKLGKYHGELVLGTGVEALPRIVLPIDWVVSGNIETIPKSLALNLTDSRETTLQVTSRRAGFKLRAAKVLEGPFSASIEQSDASISTMVRVRVSGEAANDAGLISGTLELLSNDPIEPSKKVPIQLSFYPPVVPSSSH